MDFVGRANHVVTRLLHLDTWGIIVGSEHETDRTGAGAISEGAGVPWSGRGKKGTLRHREDQAQIGSGRDSDLIPQVLAWR